MSTPAATAGRSEHDRARIARVESLRDDGAAAVPRLLAELVEPSWAVRRAVIAALSEGDRNVALALCAALRNDRSDEAKLAGIVDALSLSKANVGEALMELTRDPNPAVVCDAVQILGRHENEQALPALVALTDHADDNVALAAVEALGRIGGTAAVDSLLRLVASRNFFRTFPAIDVLGRARDPRAIPALVELSGEPIYASEAVRALGRLADPAAVPALIRLLANASEAQVRNIALALVAIREQSRQKFGTGSAVERALADSGRTHDLRRQLAQSVKRADPLEQQAIGQVLAWIGDESSVPTLLSLLEGPGAVAQVAAASLKQLAGAAEAQLIDALARGPAARRRLLIPIVGDHAAARDVVVKCLEDDDAAVRALACDALAKLSDATVVRALFALLGDTDGRVAQAALGAVQSLGSAETRSLALAASSDPNERVRCAALRIIGYFAYPEGFDALATAIEDPNERVRDSAIAGLPLFEDPRALKLLIAATRHPVVRTRTSAIRALGQTSPSEAVLAVLRVALDDESPWVRYYACQALGKLGDDGATELLTERLNDGSGQVRVAVVEALAHLRGARAFEVLSATVGSEDPDLHRAALVALGISKRPEALPQLLTALASEQVATRLVALSALAELGLPESVSAIARAVEDRDEGVAVAATGFLGTAGTRSATTELIALLRKRPKHDGLIDALGHPVPGRTEAVSDALGSADDALATALVGSLARMGTPESLQAIRDALAARNDSTRRASAAALVALDDRESAGLLEQAAFKDPDAEVRRICAAALHT